MKKLVAVLVFIIITVFFVCCPQVAHASCYPLKTPNCGRGIATCVDTNNGNKYCCTFADGGCNQMPNTLPGGIPPLCNAAGGDCLPSAYTCNTNYGRQDCPSGEICGTSCVPPTTISANVTCTPAGVAADTGIQTAIGCIPVLSSSNDFLAFILRWAVGIGGGIAFLLMIYAGFEIMTAAGNPERLKAGQELLTSAISGLILLIFSVFILKFIGVDILGLCNFGFNVGSCPK